MKLIELYQAVFEGILHELCCVLEAKFFAGHCHQLSTVIQG